MATNELVEWEKEITEKVRAAGGMSDYELEHKKEQEEFEEKHPILATIGNIPASAGRAAMNIVEPFSELANYGWDAGKYILGGQKKPETPPIIKGLGGLFGDMLKSSGIYKDYKNQQAYVQDKPLPFKMKGKNMMEQYGSDKQDLKYAVAFFDFYKDRYGGWNEFKKTLVNDPIGTLLDAMVIPGGPAAVKNIGALAKSVPGLSKYAGKISAAAKVVGEGAASLVGITTGAEKGGVINAVKSIFDKNPETRKLFADTIRGKVSDEEILKSIKIAMDEVSTQRGVEYREALGKLENANRAVDISPLQDDMSQLMERFKIDPSKGERALEDFSPRPSSTSIVQKVIDRFDRFSNNYKEHTLVGLDELKKFVGAAFLPSEQAEKGAAFSTAFEKKIDNYIKHLYPEYGEMTKAYAESKKFQRAFEKELSIGTSKSEGIAIKKLNASLKDANEYRAGLIGKLEEQTGRDLMPAISAMPFRSLDPHGLFGRSLGYAEVFGAFAKHPSVAAGLFISSPILFAETLRATEKGWRAGKKVGKVGLEHPQIGTALQNIGVMPNVLGDKPSYGSYEDAWRSIKNILGETDAGQKKQIAP
jgi:hypothetical protein